MSDLSKRVLVSGIILGVLCLVLFGTGYVMASIDVPAITFNPPTVEYYNESVNYGFATSILAPAFRGAEEGELYVPKDHLWLSKRLGEMPLELEGYENAEELVQEQQAPAEPQCDPNDEDCAVTDGHTEPTEFCSRVKANSKGVCMCLMDTNMAGACKPGNEHVETKHCLSWCYRQKWCRCCAS